MLYIYVYKTLCVCLCMHLSLRSSFHIRGTRDLRSSDPGLLGTNTSIFPLPVNCPQQQWLLSVPPWSSHTVTLLARFCCLPFLLKFLKIGSNSICLHSFSFNLHVPGSWIQRTNKSPKMNSRRKLSPTSPASNLLECASPRTHGDLGRLACWQYWWLSP
jgi:hypothetical protein